MNKFVIPKVVPLSFPSLKRSFRIPQAYDMTHLKLFTFQQGQLMKVFISAPNSWTQNFRKDQVCGKSDWNAMKIVVIKW